jgi:hypothetical protein
MEQISSSTIHSNNQLLLTSKQTLSQLQSHSSTHKSRKYCSTNLQKDSDN